jgi:hypothetical protein
MTRYCPKCRGEFQDRVEACVDCGTPLVDHLPEKWNRRLRLFELIPCLPAVPLYRCLVRADAFCFAVPEAESVNATAAGTGGRKNRDVDNYHPSIATFGNISLHIIFSWCYNYNIQK